VKDKGARHPSRSNRVTRNPELLNVISQLRICTSEVLDQNLKVYPELLNVISQLRICTSEVLDQKNRRVSW
jgi:hypothetical protein